MTIFEIIIIAAGLSLDVFAYCLYKGAMVSRYDAAQVIKLSAVCSVLQVAALLLGSAVRLLPFIEADFDRAHHAWQVLSAGLFLALGITMIVRAFRKRHEQIIERKEDTYYLKRILLVAPVTVIDAFLAGIGFSFLPIDLFALAVVVFAATVIAVVVGIWTGYRLGCAGRMHFVTVGGCIVLAGGVDVLLRYLV